LLINEIKVQKTEAKVENQKLLRFYQNLISNEHMKNIESITENSEVIKFEYDLIPWPVHTEANQTATYRGGVGYAVAATSKNPQAAAELALYLSADEEANKMYSDMDLQIPNLKSLASRYTSKPGKPANRQEYINIISKTGRPWPSDYTYNSVWYDKFYMGIQRVLDGKISVRTKNLSWIEKTSLRSEKP